MLGSGGPIANPRRASSGYLVSIDKRVRILVDAGGGVYERLGRSGADLTALEQILLTHLHIDHTSDLPAVIMDLYMRNRNRAIALAGPAGRAGNNLAPENASPQPGVDAFTRLLFGADGAWRYMNTFDNFGLQVHETPSNVAEAKIHTIPVNPALQDLGVVIRATAVPHGMMPSVAFRIECDQQSIVFSGDVSGSTPALIELAKDCSMLVHDFALPERDVPDGHLHAKPSVVGHTAQASRAKILLLSHFMPAIESVLGRSIDITRREYDGRIEVANDLETYELIQPG
ncbi:MAG TPA: MBL fold metallo-hydrolase [Candidatus Acidoferrum sp.]|nr:MBL fold metallo-hydrolase [Candidatus Acidoferrum sp.]